MRTYLAAALAATLAISAPAVTFAAQGAKNGKAPAAHKTATMKEKTARGTVKSIDDSSLVLANGMKFKLDSMAKHDGVAAGSHVTVHYKAEGKDMVASSVMVNPTAAKAKK